MSVPSASPQQHASSSRHQARAWILIYLAALFFLGTADQVFAVRVFSVNIRWAQFLLLAGAVACLPFAWQGWRAGREEVMRSQPLLLAWGVFFAAYGASALVAPDPLRSLVKLAWGGFNVVGAALVCLLAARDKTLLRDAFLIAAVLVAAVIWIDAVALYWVGAEAPALGLAQQSYRFEGEHMLRPHAFYYEPSYAGAWLAFGLPVVVLATWQRPLWMRLLLPAVVLGAIVLTSSRTGILSALMALGVAGLYALVRRRGDLLKAVVATGVMAALLLTVFFMSSQAAVYGRFIAGPLGPQALVARLLPDEPVAAAPVQRPPQKTPAAPAPAPAPAPAKKPDWKQTSEGQRLANVATALKTWWQRPLLGWGVATEGSEDKLLSPATLNTWLELLVEAGLLGLLTFVGAVAIALRMAARHADATTLALLGGAWAAHFLINLNLTQTYPRLDYWLLFFLTIRLALPDTTAAVDETAPQPSTARAA